MTPTMKELGQRAVASKAWPLRIHEPQIPGILMVRDVPYWKDEGNRWRFNDGEIPHATGWYPDLSDRATLALLRDIVASAYGGTQVTVEPPLGACRTYYVTVYNWRLIKVWQGVMSVHNYGDPELGLIEALVCALENAPASSSRQSNDT